MNVDGGPPVVLIGSAGYPFDSVDLAPAYQSTPVPELSGKGNVRA